VISGRLIAAARSGEVAQIETVFTKDATIWNNLINRQMSVAEAGGMFAAMKDKITDFRYEDVRLTALPEGFVQQHVLAGEVDGVTFHVPACLICQIRDGGIASLAEYLDSQGLAKAGLALG
jgi:ketosteroid isomerase-like protein